jgi:hypothetical protein
MQCGSRFFVCLSSQDFDWFVRPTSKEGVELHNRMLSIGDAFVSRLLGNITGCVRAG